MSYSTNKESKNLVDSRFAAVAAVTSTIMLGDHDVIRASVINPKQAVHVAQQKARMKLRVQLHIMPQQLINSCIQGEKGEQFKNIRHCTGTQLAASPSYQF
jgi:hypothetical protein